MHIKTTELRNRKSDILELLKEENYSDKHILRFMKTYDLVCDLVAGDICKTSKQLHCWFDRFFEGFNRNTVNFAQKFHSNVIRAVWDADYSEIVVHPVSYMSFTVTLN